MQDENGFRKGVSKVQNKRQAACRFFSSPLLYCQSFLYPGLGLCAVPEYDTVRSSDLAKIVSPHVGPRRETAPWIVYEGANSAKYKSDTIRRAGRRGWTERWSSVNGDTVKRDSHSRRRAETCPSIICAAFAPMLAGTTSVRR